MNPNSTIVYFGYYGGVVENRRRPDCLEWSLLFTRRALYQCPREAAAGPWRGGALLPVPSSTRPPSVLVVSSFVLPGTRLWPPSRSSR
jgi:hypothetical protein